MGSCFTRTRRFFLDSIHCVQEWLKFSELSVHIYMHMSLAKNLQEQAYKDMLILVLLG